MKVIQTTVVSKNGKVVKNSSREITFRHYAEMLVQIGRLQMHDGERIEVTHLLNGDVKIDRKLPDRIVTTGFQVVE